MFSYFPQIRNEESTYSIFSRLQFALQTPNFESMGKLLFNKKFEVGRLNFQGSFDFLCSQLPSTYTSKGFLYNNTIFPIYIPFIDENKQNRVMNYFKGDYADKVQKFLNVSIITKSKTYLRVCKECVREDLKNYGEPFYRRQHEIELNRMCLKHKTPLSEYIIFPYKIPSRYIEIYTVLNNAKKLEIPEIFKSTFLDIANDISYVFTADLTGWNIQITKGKIYNKMIEKGYISANGLTYQKDLSRDLKQYYTEEFLDYIGFNFDVDENDSWIRHATIRKKSIGDPIKYLLVIRYLFGSFENFYKYKDNNSIFKDGPYPCLNKVCPNYYKPVISDCSISISHNHPLATFKCEHCGFAYSRRGPDRNDDDIYRKTYVKEFGHIWLENLEEYIRQGFSLRKMSKLLGCTDLGTIKRYIEKIRLNEQITNDSENKTKKVPEVSVLENDLLLVEKYKSMFLEMLRTNPELNSLLLYRLYPKAYKLVSKYDRTWIENNLLKRKSPKISSNNRLNKYWKGKDEFLHKELIKSLERIKCERKLYKRITIALLQKYIGYYNLHQNKSKLPKCFNLIKSECETILKYQQRRVDYVAERLANSNKRITFTKVLYAAGLRPKTSRGVLDYIDEKIITFSSGRIIKRIKN